MGPDMTGMSDDEDMVYEDLEVGQEADVSKLKDGGCMKKVLVKGTGDERPETGAEVTVHYTGTLLDGTKFDSSVDRGDPFKFKLGVGQVIKGWDHGVASMKKGEKAILTCKPDYAYGARGSPDHPPGRHAPVRGRALLLEVRQRSLRRRGMRPRQDPQEERRLRFPLRG